ncbi:MAG: hypothetical protein HOV80_28905 [Polyangiaceae bacterium]|nr:hypothetical protein [Polyangiaceae bacterium]
MTEAQHPEAIRRPALIVGGLGLVGLIGAAIALAFLTETAADPMPEAALPPAPPATTERPVAPPPDREREPASQPGTDSTTFTATVMEVSGRDDIRKDRPCVIEAWSNGPADDSTLKELTIKCGRVELFRKSKLAGRPADAETFKLVTTKDGERYPSYATAPKSDDDMGEAVAIDPYDYIVLLTTRGPKPTSVKLGFTPAPKSAHPMHDRMSVGREVR